MVAPARKREPEIGALEAVHTALKPLSPEERGRVLASVYALLGIRGPDIIRAPSVAPAPESRSVSPSAATGVGARSQGRPLSVNELVQEKSPGTSAQRITLFAYYRDKHEGVPRFGRDDLKAYFAKAKEQPPRNYDRDFVEAVKRGWIHEDGDDSYVTSKGIEAVESGFAGERKYIKRARRPRTMRGSPAKPKTGGQRKTRGGR